MNMEPRAQYMGEIRRLEGLLAYAVSHFMRWAKDTDDVRMKYCFYSNLDKSVLFEQGYIAEK